MGITISLHVYPLGELLNDIEEYVEKNGGYRENALPVRQFFMKIAPEFGVIADGKFYVVWNEYFEEYNSGSNFLSCIDDYYFPNHEALGKASEDGYWDGFWSDNYEILDSGATSRGVLQSLFEEEFGYEGKFR